MLTFVNTQLLLDIYFLNNVSLIVFLENVVYTSVFFQSLEWEVI